jgi:hypothetical protein
MALEQRVTGRTRNSAWGQGLVHDAQHLLHAGAFLAQMLAELAEEEGHREQILEPRW